MTKVLLLLCFNVLLFKVLMFVQSTVVRAAAADVELVCRIGVIRLSYAAWLIKVEVDLMGQWMNHIKV